MQSKEAGLSHLLYIGAHLLGVGYSVASVPEKADILVCEDNVLHSLASTQDVDKNFVIQGKPSVASGCPESGQ